MLFPTHAVIGLIISLILGYGYVPLVIGSIIPDLVDKPLGMLDITSKYQTAFHSGIAALLALCIGSVDYLYNGRVIILLFSIGWIVHIFSDMAHMIVNSRPYHVKFVLWPFSYHSNPLRLPPGKFYKHYKWSRSFYVEIGIWIVFIMTSCIKIYFYLI